MKVWIAEVRMSGMEIGQALFQTADSARRWCEQVVVEHYGSHDPLEWAGSTDGVCWSAEVDYGIAVCLLTDVNE